MKYTVMVDYTMSYYFRDIEAESEEQAMQIAKDEFNKDRYYYPNRSIIGHIVDVDAIEQD